MPIEFDVNLTEKDMYRFNLHHAYTGSQGILATLIALAVLAMAFVTRGRVSTGYTVLYFVFGLVFLVYMPITLWFRSKSLMKRLPVLRERIQYLVDAAGVHVTIGEESAELPWDMIYRMVSTKHNLLLYSTRINAYVIPRSQLGDNYEPLAALAREHLERFRVKGL